LVFIGGGIFVGLSQILKNQQKAIDLLKKKEETTLK